ncbi:hypothetical protein MMC22_001805 [Lobaria immixta]|nr:hypothetical protein [Lobaria immixta]
MYCNLLKLPTEIHLKIIEELIRDEDIETHTNDLRKLDDDHSENDDEPIKIYHDLINWSCTCSHFRNLLAPNIFKTTKLVNNEKSGFSLNAVAKSPYNVHIKELHFIGSALGIDHSEGPTFLDPEWILPFSVDALLCSLQRFPSLEKLSIKFDHELEILDVWEELEFAGALETPGETLEAESSRVLRALMFRTYSVLTHNKSPHFKHLEIRQLIWREVSAFSHAAFHDFLGHFERFTLSIYGKDLRGGWMSGQFHDYVELMEKLDEHFFNHLASVTILSIKAPRAGPLGLFGRQHTLLCLKADQMPMLTTLHLDGTFASPKLIDFVVGHKHSLEELILRNCYVSPVHSRFLSDVYWSHLFNSLYFACPTQLRHLELVVSDAALPSKRQSTDEGNEWVCTTPRENRGRMLFLYVHLETRKGDLV